MRSEYGTQDKTNLKALIRVGWKRSPMSFGLSCLPDVYTIQRFRQRESNEWVFSEPLNGTSGRWKQIP